MKKIILTGISLFTFLFGNIGPLPNTWAEDFYLPTPGVMVNLSPEFNLPVFRGLKIHPDDPFLFDFIVDQGDSISDAQNEFLKKESTKLIKYFLASLTIPEKDLWVNLSPYEKSRIIPQSFGRTQMGRDLLAEDYILKQITASLIYPEGEIGKRFWQRIYQEAARTLHTTNIPVNTFNKVWIVPDKAVVYENAKAGTAYVVESKLKVMLEQDYLSLYKHVANGSKRTFFTSSLGSDTVRQIVIPELTKEVNYDKNFAPLRQVYNSLILATWYKKKIKASILAAVYENKNKIKGAEYENSVITRARQNNDIQLIYNRYLAAFKKGAYNYIKEEIDPITQLPVPRKYFSGGVNVAQLGSHEAYITSIPSRAMLSHATIVRAMLRNFGSRPGKISRRSFLRGGTALGGLALFKPRLLWAQNLSSFKADRVKAVLRFFDDNSNPTTGFAPSYFGDNSFPIRRFGASSYDLSLQAIAQAGGRGLKIIRTYARNVSQARGENAPATINMSFQPAGGILSNLRVKNYGEPEWWNNWEWKVSAGDNAWIGIAALYNYTTEKDSDILQFAKERAEFLKNLQDADGGIRFGPKGQFHDSGDKEFWWKVKSTENNESVLFFFDMLYEITKDEQYKRIADRIYNWLITQMYDPQSYTFSRGAKFVNARWVKDTTADFAPDTTNWAPLERILPLGRMLNDSRLGSTRLERLQQFERIIKATETLAGVYQGNILKGISYSPETKSQGIISIEWSSQFALRYLRVAQEYAALKTQVSGQEKVNLEKKEQEYNQKYDALIAQIGSYFRKRDGYLVAPYAVYANGRMAAGMDTGHGWIISSAYAAAANVYYAFALAKFDPFTLDWAMKVNPKSHDQAIVSHLTRSDRTGGIDFTSDKALSVQNSGPDIKFHIDPAMLQQFQGTLGFIPVVVSMEPTNNVRGFLGYQKPS